MTTDAAVLPPTDRATPLGRAAWTLLGLASMAVVACAAWLRPDPRGFGTHTQLGLPPCAFSAVTGVPCPGCGLTTSFALVAHGHLLDAFRAHLMGPPLFAIVATLAVYAPYAIVRGRPLRTLYDARLTLPALLLTAASGVLTFAFRLAHLMPPR